MKTLILNLFGGPGTGKSTACAAVFAELKLRGVNCEMATEFAKDRVWEETEIVLNNQIYVFGEQLLRVWRLLGKVDIIITDSPLLLSIIYYRGNNEHFPRLVFEEHRRLLNRNVFLRREKPYNPAGRLQTEEEAKALDGRIWDVLNFLGEDYLEFPANRGSVSDIADVALECWKDANTPFRDWATFPA